MANVKRAVLVVVDPTASAHPAIERAAWLARHEPAEIELFISDYTPQLAQSRSDWPAEEARTTCIERHRSRLEQLAAPLRAEKLAVDVDARWDYPLHDSIVRKAQEANADLVIKDTHYHSVLKRSIFSNTDWSLIRNCGATLWLVKPRPPGQRPCFVAAVDPLHQRDKPAELDHRILAAARALADSLKGEVHAFHAFDVAAAIAVSTDAMSMTEQLRADAVVMGAVSRSGLKGLFLGNTAEDVLDRLHCDLIIVKPDSFKAVQPG